MKKWGNHERGTIPGEVCAVYYVPQNHHHPDYKTIPYLGLIFCDQKFDQK